MSTKDDFNEFHFWFGAFSMLAGAVLLAVGTGFLYYGLGPVTGVVEVLAFLAAAFFDLNGLALIVQGAYAWIRAN